MGKMCLGLGKKLSVVGKKWKIGGEKINSNFGKKHFSSSVIQQILIRHAMPDYKKTPETRKTKQNWS